MGVSEYCRSGYVQTTDAGRIGCVICFPVKSALFLPCFLGALCNAGLNWGCATQTNYFF